MEYNLQCGNYEPCLSCGYAGEAEKCPICSKIVLCYNCMIKNKCEFCEKYSCGCLYINDCEDSFCGKMACKCQTKCVAHINTPDLFD